MEALRRQFLLFVFSLIGFISTASASLEWLDWQAPPQCDGDAHIAGRLTDWLGEGWTPERELRVQAHVSYDSQNWQVEAHFHYGSEQGERTVQVGSCTEAADFVALAIALTVQPEFNLKEPLPIEAPVGAEPDDTAVRAEPEDTRGGILRAEVARFGRHQGEPPALQAEGVVKDATPAVRPFPWGHWFASGAVVVGWGNLPGRSVGPQLSLGYRSSGWRMALGAQFFPWASREVGGENPARFMLLSSTASACFLFFDKLRLGPCTGAQLGAVTAKEESTGQGGTRLWGAISVGGTAEWAWSQYFAGLFNADLVIPVVRPRFRLGTVDGSEDAFVPGAGFQVQIGTRVFF